MFSQQSILLLSIIGIILIILGVIINKIYHYYRNKLNEISSTQLQTLRKINYYRTFKDY